MWVSAPFASEAQRRTSDADVNGQLSLLAALKALYVLSNRHTEDAGARELSAAHVVVVEEAARSVADAEDSIVIFFSFSVMLFRCRVLSAGNGKNTVLTTASAATLRRAENCVLRCLSQSSAKNLLNSASDQMRGLPECNGI